MTFHSIFLWSVLPQLTRNDCHKRDSSLRNHRTQWHSINILWKSSMSQRRTAVARGTTCNGLTLGSTLFLNLTLAWDNVVMQKKKKDKKTHSHICPNFQNNYNKLQFQEGCCALTVKPWEEPHIGQAVSALLWKAWVQLSNQWLFSVSRPLVSCVPVCGRLCDWKTRVCDSFSCMGGGKVCLREKYTPSSSSAASPLLPFAPWLLLGECLCVFVSVCVCVCHSPAPGREAFSRGAHWLSHSYVRIRQIHLHFLTVTHSFSRGIPVLCFGSLGHTAEEMRSFRRSCGAKKDLGSF